MYIHYIICIYFLRKSKRQTVQSTNSSIYELLNRASTLPERRSTFAPRASTKRQQTPQLCLCFAGPLEMGAAEGLPVFLPRCLLSCFFLSLKFRTDEWNLRDVLAGKFTLMSCLAPSNAVAKMVWARF